jgi:dimethylhistidine N-methyltransferase
MTAREPSHLTGSTQLSASSAPSAPSAPGASGPASSRSAALRLAAEGKRKGQADGNDRFRQEVLQGLRSSPRTVPSKYLYDARGSALFDEICTLAEYYPTRTELGIMREHVGEMAALAGPGAVVVELGSGSAIKTELLLAALHEPAAYIPIDIAQDALGEASARVAARFPGLRVAPVCADYTAPLSLPLPAGGPVLVYFPGSTVGNFTTEEARGFLRRIRDLCAPSGGGLLIGVDLDKAPRILNAAYDDARGVTAAFNLNLLARMNRELGADFHLEAFRHAAPYDAAIGRVEMRLISLRAQRVHVAGEAFDLSEGEAITTEYSYKYSPARFASVAEAAGFRVNRVWTDPASLFSVQHLIAG